MQVLHTELEQSMNVEQVIATKLGDYKKSLTDNLSLAYQLLHRLPL